MINLNNLTSGNINLTAFKIGRIFINNAWVKRNLTRFAHNLQHIVCTFLLRIFSFWQMFCAIYQAMHRILLIAVFVFKRYTDVIRLIIRTWNNHILWCTSLNLRNRQHLALIFKRIINILAINHISKAQITLH